MAKVRVEVPAELVDSIRKVARELEAGLTAIGSGKPLDVAGFERRATSSASEVEREGV